MDVRFRAAPNVEPRGVRYTFDAARGTRSGAQAGASGGWAEDVGMTERASPTDRHRKKRAPRGRPEVISRVSKSRPC